MAKEYSASVLTVYDENGNRIPIPLLQYSLTEADKQEIAQIVLEALPSAEEVAL